MYVICIEIPYIMSISDQKESKNRRDYECRQDDKLLMKLSLHELNSLTSRVQQ